VTSRTTPGTENASLPATTRELLAAAYDDDKPRTARVRALATLEKTRDPHRHDVARALTPLLGAAPDLATHVHVALLGRAPPGTWWHDERACDHRGARRWHIRLDRPASSTPVIRRERALRATRDAVVVEMGDTALEKSVMGRGLVAWVEEEDGLVVALTITWSSWAQYRPGAEPQPPKPKAKQRL
jgi:hypothetical protein